MKLNSRTAFLIGPLASPSVVLVVVILVSIISGTKEGFLGLIQGSAFVLAAVTLYSYIFTFMFGLPIYYFFIRKDLKSWPLFNLGALLSTILLGLVMLALGQGQNELALLMPVLFFAICNANLMWYLLKKTVNKSSHQDASEAGASA